MGRSNNFYQFRTPKYGHIESGLFSIKGRISRAKFWLRLSFAVAIYLVSFMANDLALSSDLNGILLNFIDTIHLYITPVILLFFISIQAAKRIHDVNLSAWYFFVPVYNLLLCLRPGTVGDNNYGVNPILSDKVQYFDEFEKLDDHLKNREVKTIFGSSKLDLDVKLWISVFTILFVVLIYFKSVRNPLIGNNEFNSDPSLTNAASSENNSFGTNINNTSINQAELSNILEESHQNQKNGDASSLDKSGVNQNSNIGGVKNFNGLSYVVTPIKRNPNPKNGNQNLYFNKDYTLFDYLNKDEPIFPVNNNGKIVYQIYYSSNERPIPYYGEFTPEQLENHYYYKFKDEQSCLEYHATKRKSSWEGVDKNGMKTNFKRINNEDWIETNDRGFFYYTELKSETGKTILREIHQKGVFIYLSSLNCFFRDSLHNWEPKYSGGWTD